MWSALRAPVSVAAPGWRGRATPARTSVVVRLGKWPKVIGGVRSWRGIKFDEFSFEVKKCGDGTAAEELMREFLESDGLDQDFCQSAFDTVHLAYRQRRPPEEVALLQDMATTLMRAHREKVQLPEEFLADSLLMSFNTKDPSAAMNGDADAARRVAEIRAELRRVFVDGKPPTMTGTSGYAADPTPSMENQIDLSKFLTHLERCKTRAREDAKWGRSMAATAIDANERAVQEFEDPMDEIEKSRAAFTETGDRIDALQEIVKDELFRR